ncbi:uncharacterized protein LOC119536983 isoform X2 [Choloepus didactylus]|uniref:uncharacterized protein LOC119536983 isoform X2 n=1 Tax=Choloepus didactylus TaxID=27675 RepID=UPI0018A03EFA|nr:uncharacterized protein LOC119536983 isoform X2 [Choloepus didactylus]XP_037695566.1 uncharacterized protein LOC119536983 isoform X2 [Choloepus didactylus]XP_037695571.1 uncharacterized protein LOC119536983 isoform X2 [Choloepus didactylus]
MIWGYLGCWCTSKSSGAPGTWRRLLQSRYSCWQRRGTEASPEPAAAEIYSLVAYTLTSRWRMRVTYFPQVVLLSASMPINMLEVIKKLMRNPFQILVMKEDLALERIMVYNNFERGKFQSTRRLCRNGKANHQIHMEGMGAWEW